MTLKTKDSLKLNQAEQDFVIASLANQGIAPVSGFINTLLLILPEELRGVVQSFAASRIHTYSRLKADQCLKFLIADLELSCSYIEDPNLQAVLDSVKDSRLTELWAGLTDRAEKVKVLYNKLYAPQPVPSVEIPTLTTEIEGGS